MPENWFISTTVKIALNYDNNCTNDKAGFVDITASNAIQRHTGDVTNRPSFKKKQILKNIIATIKILRPISCWAQTSP